MLSEGRRRDRSSAWLALAIIGASWLAALGAFVTVRALWGWLT